MARRQRKHLRQRKFLLAPLALLCGALAYGIVLGDNGLRSYLSLRQTLAERAAEAQKHIIRNHDLQQRLTGIRSNKRVLEEVARARLGVVGADEIVYVFSGPSQPHEH